MFSSTNSLGQGEYFAGFTPDSQKTDDVTRDFGNTSEICLSSALSYISNGVFTASTSNQTMSVNGASKSAASVIIKDVFTPQNFKGLIYSPRNQRYK